MTLARVATMAAIIHAVAGTASAQRPDLSGTWRLDPASARNAGPGGALDSGPATITQTADALTIARPAGGDPVTVTYKLDGSDSRNMMAGPGGELVDSMSTARWDGPRLTIVTRQETGGQLAQSTEVWTVTGSTLTVETTDARGTRRRVYTKSS
jgi:hypothetical protein